MNRIKKLASVVLSAVVCGASQVFAAEPETVWTVDDYAETLVITEQPSSGTAWEFTLSAGGVLTKTTAGGSKSLNFKTISLPDGYAIRSFASSFLSGNTSVQHLYFPSTVTNISDSAFNGCTSLVTCDFPEGTPIERVGNQAFMNDAALVAQIGRLCPPTVTWLGGWAFYKCGKVTGKVSLPALAGFSTSQGGNKGQQFYKCGLRDAEITSPFLTSTCGFFPNCYSITNITIACENLTSIGTVFALNCNKLKSVTIDCPKLGSVAANAFYHDNASYTMSINTFTILNRPFVQNGTDNTVNVIDQLLADVVAVDSETAAAKNCTIYVQASDASRWRPYADALAGYESAHAPKYAFGVYSASSRKAYMAALGGSPGFAIIVR